MGNAYQTVEGVLGVTIAKSSWSRDGVLYTVFFLIGMTVIFIGLWGADQTPSQWWASGVVVIALIYFVVLAGVGWYRGCF